MGSNKNRAKYSRTKQRQTSDLLNQVAPLKVKTGKHLQSCPVKNKDRKFGNSKVRNMVLNDTPTKMNSSLSVGLYGACTNVQKHKG